MAVSRLPCAQLREFPDALHLFSFAVSPPTPTPGSSSYTVALGLEDAFSPHSLPPLPHICIPCLPCREFPYSFIIKSYFECKQRFQEELTFHWRKKLCILKKEPVILQSDVILVYWIFVPVGIWQLLETRSSPAEHSSEALPSAAHL